jgi:cobalt-zinc-cadmium efflux system membrane fusion protein
LGSALFDPKFVSVLRGQVLAVISSPEVGQARADVLSAQSAYELVAKQVARTKVITDNLRLLFRQLDKGASLEDIERQFRQLPLGNYRSTIFSAYSRRYYAKQSYEAARPLSESGAIAQITVRERDNDLHIADSAFRSVRESAEFDTSVQKQKLDAELANARRQVMLATNHLETLLGYSEDDTKQQQASLSTMEVRAPFYGTIESRVFAKSERVEQTDPMFVLANTTSLYVTADIRENEWKVLGVCSGTELIVVAPALAGRSFVAKVHYIGREVAADSNSIPLVATIQNTAGLLRPGMFVRVTIPTSQTGEVLAVRQESVLQHENRKFVFVAVNEDTYRKAEVETGSSDRDWIQVTAGLQPGDLVVADGATLSSENPRTVRK